MKKIIAGVDEVGIGPIAGPVVAVAVILNPTNMMYKLRDSKILSAKQREILYKKIKEKALDVSIGIASVEEIDSLNIFHANMLAMERAIKSLKIIPDLIKIDGRSSPKMDLPIETIVDGDATEKTISAASIIAKVTRDLMMINLHKEYPNYNFHRHKGYSTKEHQKLLIEFGPCPIHRRSFSIVKKMIEKVPIEKENHRDEEKI